MTTPEVESFLTKFKALSDKRLQLEAEYKLLESEKLNILEKLNMTSVTDIQIALTDTATEVTALLKSLEMPQEILDELKHMG